MGAKVAHLGQFLNQLRQTYHVPAYLNSDPLEFVHHYKDPWDQEAVGLFAALLAYGRVSQIRRSVSDALERMEALGGTPSGFVRSYRDKQYLPDWKNAFQGWAHRFNQGGDLEILTLLLAESWDKHGSLGAHFMKKHDPDAENFGPGLNLLIADWRKSAELLNPHLPVGNFGYFLTTPKDGSCCKRWCMFLRWMGRSDALDPGLWTVGGGLSGTFTGDAFLFPRQLVIPMDTHIGRISNYLGLTNRRTLDWKAALEVTATLKLCDPPASQNDPVMYDFALSRLGILEICTRSFRPEICGRCPLVSVCRFAKKKEVSRELGVREPAERTL